ncbi:transcriptional regulator [Flavobacterium sp. 5]|uniref:transcriptional regulator n=1 Tax=Flavobacterium sp. 5 TaxID=2035199 RepID=UPI000C2CD2A8|nr:transcriptional regulator [Flavobacterium sp. 5]PKB17237.1 hypothetical protein CLU82_2422 [Flavobacterium sp. 5]
MDTTNFWVVNWYYVTGIAISATALIFAIKNYRKKNKPSELQPQKSIEAHISPQISPQINPVNSLTVNFTEGSSKFIENTSVNDNHKDREFKVDAQKSKFTILFIDDDKNFNIVKILKDSGWKNTSSVTDIKNLDIQAVKDADLFFIDINGVGKLMNCEFEGLDLALMLKQKYSNKKVVIYSANKNFNAFHSAWDICDFKLEKNALPLQFISLVEKFSLEK